MEDFNWELRYQFVELALSNGVAVMVISRIHPRRLDKQFLLKDAELIWLTTTPSNDGAKIRTIMPDSSIKIHMTIQGFLKEKRGAVVLLDGLEYLISQNGFNMTMKLLQLLNEAVSISDAIMLIPVNTDALDESWLGILRRELHPLTDDGIDAYIGGLEKVN